MGTRGLGDPQIAIPRSRSVTTDYDPTSGLVFNDTETMTSLGNQPEYASEIKIEERTANYEDKLLIIASDGFWDENVWSLDDIRQAVVKLQGHTADGIARGLAETARARGSIDDITVVVVPMSC